MGALGGGVGGSVVAKKVADGVVDDDSKNLLKIVHEEIGTLAFEYMLTEDEVEYIASEVRRTANPKWLRRMFKETNRGTNCERLRKLVRKEFEPGFEALVQRRPKVKLPTVEQVEEEALKLVETVAAGVDQNAGAWLDSPVPSP